MISSFDGRWFSNISRIYGQTNKIFDNNLTPARKFHLLWSWSKLIFLSLINEYSKQKNVLSKKNISFKFQAVKEIAY